ncbi:MAG: DNA internalization-related competence protein ComEC/Rec2 [Oscillospiraceae bacterium]
MPIKHQKPVVRTLAWVALSYAVGIFLAQYFLPTDWCLPGAVILVLLSGLGCFLKGSMRQRVWLLCIPMCVGLLWNTLYTVWFVDPSEALVGEEYTISGYVTDYVEDFGAYQCVTIRQTGEQLPKVKTRLYDYDNHLPENLTPGDTITATVKITSALTAGGELTDSFTSDGIFMRAYLRGDAAITGQSSVAVVLYFPVRVCHRLLFAVETAFPEDVFGLLAAVLTGDRTALYENSALYTDMKLSGIVHVVAVSGMHVALLCAFLFLLFGHYRTSIFGIPLIWLFAMMTGLNPSVVRAAFMQTVLLLAPLLKRDSDPITSLSASWMLLILINPYAIKSVGLQLTFAATAGLLLLSSKIFAWFTANGERCAAKASKLPKCLVKVQNTVRDFCVASISATIGATVFTVPIVAYYFGYVSVYAVLTNLLIVPAITILFCGGYVVILLTLLLPSFGALLGSVLAWVARYAIWVIHRVAALPYSAVYTTNPQIVVWIGFVYILFFVSYCLRERQNRFRPILPICMSLCTLCAVLFLEIVGDGKDSITVLDVGQGQCIAAFTDRATVLIDCGGSGSGAAGSTAAAYLHGHGRDTVDALILTHLHVDHTNGIEMLYNSVEIERIILPSNVDDSDAMLDVLLDLAEEHHTKLYFIEEDTVLTVGALTVPLYVSNRAKGRSANERGLLLLADFGDFEALMTGDADIETEQDFLNREGLPDIELLVVGHHGSKYATCQQLLDKLQPEVAAISVGYNNYGHPTEEVLERLKALNLEVYRTDCDGTITIKVG